MKPKVKAIGLVSGGLDSTLALRLMLNQQVEVFGLHFITPFCVCKMECGEKVWKEYNIKVKTEFLGEEYIHKVVKSPKYGYGKNLNPCIDCRIFMFSKAKNYMEKMGASFVFTGEVVNERPMSQRRDILKLIEKETGLVGKILRPLSAKLLPPTIVEKEGLIHRELLLSLSGRNRKPQIKLAKQWGIKNYPSPAGGCRLTDPQFARKMKDALKYEEISLKEINLLRYGRHFRLKSGTKVVVGRNEGENYVLKGMKEKEDVLLEPLNCPGPTVLVKNKKSIKDVEMGAKLCARYSDKHKGVKIKYNGGVLIINSYDEKEFEECRI